MKRKEQSKINKTEFAMIDQLESMAKTNSNIYIYIFVADENRD